MGKIRWAMKARYFEKGEKSLWRGREVTEERSEVLGERVRRHDGKGE